MTVGTLYAVFLLQEHVRARRPLDRRQEVLQAGSHMEHENALWRRNDRAKKKDKISRIESADI